MPATAPQMPQPDVGELADALALADRYAHVADLVYEAVIAASEKITFATELLEAEFGIDGVGGNPDARARPTVNLGAYGLDTAKLSERLEAVAVMGDRVAGDFEARGLRLLGEALWELQSVLSDEIGHEIKQEIERRTEGGDDA